MANNVRAIATNDQPQQPKVPRNLHVYTQGFRNKTLMILDEDKQTPLYTINTNSNIFSSKPDLTLLSPPTSTSSRDSSSTIILDTANFGVSSRSIDLQFPRSGNYKSDISLTAPGIFSRSLEFESSTMGTLTWEYSSPFGTDLQLINTQGEWIAKFKKATFAVSKWGHFEIAPGPDPGTEGTESHGPGKRMLDEIVLSGIAFLERVRRRNV